MAGRRWKRNSWHLASKFVLLQIAFFVALLLLIGMVGGGRLSNYFETIIFPNLRQQGEYLLVDLRNHFDDQVYLERLATRLKVELAVEQDGKVFATSQVLVQLLANSMLLERHHRDMRSPFSLGFLHAPKNRPMEEKSSRVELPGKVQGVEWQDRSGIYYSEPGFRALIFYNHDIYPYLTHQLWILAFGTLALLVLVLVLVLWLLRPLQDLRRGIANIEAGRYDQPIKSRSSDEFGLLTQAFNRMSRRIVEQFRQREQLLADISHELRSPLTRMRVALEFIQDSKASRMLREDIREQEELLANLLDNAKLGAGVALDFQPVDLAGLLTRVVASYKNPRLKLHGAAQPLTLHADPTLLPRVFINVIDNALKYSTEHIQIELHSVDKGLEVLISDRGEGIPAEARARVFEAFYRVDASRTRASGGYGLGLSLCKRVVRAHSGSIGIDDNYQPGTRMRVRLPLRPTVVK